MPAGRKITPTKIQMGKDGNQLVRLEIPLKQRALALRDVMFTAKYLQPPINGFFGMLIEQGIKVTCKEKGIDVDKLKISQPAGDKGATPPPATAPKAIKQPGNKIGKIVAAGAKKAAARQSAKPKAKGKSKPKRKR